MAHLQAQPILSHTGDMPIGTELTFFQCTNPGITVGEGGAGILWDFSGLTVIDTTYKQIIHPDSTPYSSQFPTATHVEVNDDGSYVFVQRTNADDLVGFITPGLAITYNDPYRFLQRPLAYGDQLSDISTRSYWIASEQYIGSGSSTTTVDGYGTLLLPNGEFENVLRVKFDQQEIDSATISGAITQVHTITYAWYDQDHRSALLKIDSTFILNPFYMDTMISIACLHQETVAVEEASVLPPFQMIWTGTELWIASDLPPGTAIDLHFYTFEGKLTTSLRTTITGPSTVVTFPFDIHLPAILIAMTTAGNRPIGTSLKIAH